MTDQKTRFCYDTQNLFSSAGDWTFRILLQLSSNDRNATATVIDQQNGLASEVSKLLIFSGTEMVEWFQHQNQYYSIKELLMLPKSKQIDVRVEPCTLESMPAMLETCAQKILTERRIDSLVGDAAQVLAFIYLNDRLFQIDPAKLIFLVEEAQYDEYDYLAAMFLHQLQCGIHPERMIHDTFEKMGLGGRYSDDSLSETLQAINQTLHKALEITPLTDALLHERPDLFIYSALLQTTLVRIAPPHNSETTDMWEETFEFAEKMIAGESLESTYQSFCCNPVFDQENLEPDDRRYALSAIRQTLESAKILVNNRALQAVIHPEQQILDNPAIDGDSSSPMSLRSRFDIRKRLGR